MGKNQSENKQQKKTVDNVVQKDISNVVDVDIRLFVACLAIAMSVCFFGGIVFEPHKMSGDAFASSTVGTEIVGKSTSEFSPTVNDPQPLQFTRKLLEMSRKENPWGQHLIMDIRGVESDFLDSEERLTKAIIETVELGGSTILSHHCHKLKPSGISCIGVLLKSHISFHTWPAEGVITLDVFTTETADIVPMIPEIEKIFGVPSGTAEFKSKWSAEIRGFHADFQDGVFKTSMNNFSDFDIDVLSPLDVDSKYAIYSNRTKYHHVEIWEGMEFEDQPSHEEVVIHNLQPGDPRLFNSEITNVEREFYVDGEMKYARENENIDGESLAHPALFTHTNPKSVVVIGFDTLGGIIRDILKHNTIESITLIEKDDELISLIPKYYPELLDCSLLIGRSDNCWEDDVVSFVNEDPISWLKKRNEMAESNNKIDVIILDSWTDLKGSEAMDDVDFVPIVMNSLADDGMFYMLAGSVPDIDHPRQDKSVYYKREELFQNFEKNDEVGAMLLYGDLRPSYQDDASIYLLVCKNSNCRERWYARMDVIDYEIHQRIIPMKKASDPRFQYDSIRYFDGATHFINIQTPKGFETLYCRREPMPFECAYRHLDAKAEIFELTEKKNGNNAFDIETIKSDTGDVIGSRVIAKVNIPEGSYIMPDQSAVALALTSRNIRDLRNEEGNIEQNILSNIQKSIHTDGNNFIQVGGTSAIRRAKNPTEGNVGKWFPANKEQPVYSPVYERHRISFNVFIVATKNIVAGTELLIWE